MRLGIAKIEIKWGSGEFYPNFVPAGKCFVIMQHGVYYTFADQNKTIKYDKLLLAKYKHEFVLKTNI